MEGSSVVSAPVPVATPALVPVASQASVPAAQEEGPPVSLITTPQQITALVQVQPTAVQAANAPITALALAAPTPLDLHTQASPQHTKLNIIKGKSSYLTCFFLTVWIHSIDLPIQVYQ